MFAHSAEATTAAMAVTEACGRPRWAKLSPNAGDLVPIVDAAVEGGAEAVTLVNTVMGMAIDPVSRTYRLGNGGEACRAPPSTRLRSGQFTMWPPPDPRYRSSESVASPMPRRRLNYWWRGPVRSKWEPPASGIPVRPDGLRRAWLTGA